MALSGIIRRSIAPIAARLLVSQRKFNNPFLVPSFSRCSYSASPIASPSSDESLLRFIESEINCSKKGFKAVGGAPVGFPFEISDNLGQQTLSLTREYQGETIRIEVEPSSFITAEDDDGTGKDSPSTLIMVVEVSKAGVPSLVFGLTAYPQEIVIESLTISDPDMPEDQLPYEGPRFDQLDGNIQKSFHKFLETRGINPGATNFLHQYMLIKDHTEYTHWLKNLKKIVEA